VTQEAYQRVIGSNPSLFKGPRLPVESVTWDQAKAYCDTVGMRLPTEAEWEYAARAGNPGARYDSLDAIAWPRQLRWVDSRCCAVAANAFGLYDMLGNVWQWVADWYDEAYYGRSPATDPLGPASGTLRVLRGGSWQDDLRHVRASDRPGDKPTYRSGKLGFRCAGKRP